MLKENKMSSLFIGTSGYYFEDWVGSVYPPNTKKTEMFEEYISLGFNALELNFTYYKLADAKQLRNFSLKGDKDFSFIIKAYKGITHENKGSEIIKIVSNNYNEGNEKNNFKGMLLQFPESFHQTSQNVEYLLKIKEIMKNINLFVEFRRFDWINEDIFDLLRKNNISYVSTDLPTIGNLPEKHIDSTTETSYMRLHGRNKNWYTAKDRYDYLYSNIEITEFQKDTLNLMTKSNRAFIFFNNCHGGFAVKNAMMLKENLIRENFIEEH